MPGRPCRSTAPPRDGHPAPEGRATGARRGYGTAFPAPKPTLHVPGVGVDAIGLVLVRVEHPEPQVAQPHVVVAPVARWPELRQVGPWAVAVAPVMVTQGRQEAPRLDVGAVGLQVRGHGGGHTGGIVVVTRGEHVVGGPGGDQPRDGLLGLTLGAGLAAAAEVAEMVANTRASSKWTERVMAPAYSMPIAHRISWPWIDTLR
jgi:hypothetical protein